jgi:hypothetical protein
METVPFHCSAEWHFARLQGKGRFFAATLYSFAFHLSKSTGSFFASIPRMAEYFGVDERTVRKALHALEQTGFFELLAKPRGRPRQYRVVGHKEWASLRPGVCPQKEQTPWEDEPKDELGKMLYAISAGRFRPYPNFLKGMRRTGHSDLEIARHFRGFMKTYRPKNMRIYAMGLCKQFMSYLRSQPVVEMQPQAAKTPANPLHVM